MYLMYLYLKDKSNKQGIIVVLKTTAFENVFNQT